MAIGNVINTGRYPLLDLQTETSQKLLKEFSEEFHSQGILVLEDFIHPQALGHIVDEATSLIPEAHFQHVVGNAYLDSLDLSLPEDHARRITDSTHLGAIANDQIPESSPMKQLYLLPEVTEFIRTIVNLPTLYHYGCPLSCLNYTVMRAGDKLRWHFDQSDFVVSIPLQDSGAGGKFEYVRNIRSPDNENYEQVKAVLLGDMTNVQEATTPPGSLVLFQGRYTIHRVTEVGGQIPRMGALLSYADVPGLMGTDYLKLIRYGRVD